MISASRLREVRPDGRTDALTSGPDVVRASTAPPWSSAASAAATASGRADRDGDPPPGRQPGEGPWEMHDNPPHRALDPYREFEQALPQGGDLGVGASGPGRATAQFLEQNVRGE